MFATLLADHYEPMPRMIVTAIGSITGTNTMKHINALLVTLVFSTTASGQCTISTLGLDSATQHTKLRGLVLDATGMTAVMKPFLPGGLRPRTIIVSRNGLDGTPIWQRRITHTNPSFDLEPHGIARGPLGEVIVYGEITHTPYGNQGQSAYYTQFAIRVDSLGGLDWARIYKLPTDGYLGSRSEQQEGLVGLQSGHYAWCFQAPTGADGTRLMELDSDGLPVTCRSYITGPDTMTYRRPLRAMLGPDGSMYACHYGAHEDWNLGTYSHFTDVFKVDPTGTFEWGTRVQTPLWMSDLFWGQSGAIPMVHTPNGSTFSLDQSGDLLVAAANDGGGPDHFLRFSSTGQLVWESEETSGGYRGTRGLTSLPNGDLLHIAAHPLQPKLVLGAGTGGGPVQAWSHTYAPQQIWSAPGILALSLGTSPAAPFTKLALASDAASLGVTCEFAPSTHGAASMQSNPSFPLQITTDTVVAQSWPMSIADSTGMALDLGAACSMQRVSPGFTTTLVGAAINQTGTASGPLTITCTLPTQLLPLAYTPTPASIVGNLVTWNVPAGLPPDSYWSFSVVAQCPPDPLLLGTTVSATVSVSQPDPETDPTNNTATASRVVAGPYDPNNKLAQTSSGLSNDVYFQGTDEWIDYTINFQNTGTAPAVDVVLVDTLPPSLRVQSLVVTGGTHPFRYELSASGVLRFIFDNINLPDSNANEPASHGAVNFRIKPEAGLAPGTLIANRADIFFDFNPAVRTEDCEVWIDFITSVEGGAVRERLRVHPVPVRDVLHVLPPNGTRIARLDIHSLDGRLVQSARNEGSEGPARINVATLAPQVYVLSLTSADGQRHTARFVKE